VSKAVLQYYKPGFILLGGQQGEKEWNKFYTYWHSIVASPTEIIYQERLTSLESKFAGKHVEAVGYVKTFWLEPYKERIVKAWVDRHLHFGNIATSRQVA
jgi:hypothetical protein